MCFIESLKQGRLGEYAIRDCLERQPWVRQVIDLSLDKRHQEKDIDIMIENLSHQFVTAEIKTDLQAHQTGNLAYEVSTSGNIGCLEKTEADWIIFYVPENNTAYVLITERLRDYVNQHRDSWKEIPMGDYSLGYLLSISELNYHKIIHKTLKEVI